MRIRITTTEAMMARNTNLTRARVAANDEFYTQYADIEREMNAYLDYDPDVFRGKTVLLPCDDPEWSNFTRYFVFNFARLGLKKLISTSYAPKSKNNSLDLFSHAPGEAERANPNFDAERSLSKGRLFVLTGDTNQDQTVDMTDLHWTYLDGDGDFRSPEVTALRDEADIIITNPPFSLFRIYMAWIIAADKRFVVVANKSCITYKEIFPLIKDNLMWTGNGFYAGNAYFRTNQNAPQYSEGVYDESTGLVKFRNVGWFTNIEHGRRHERLSLETTANNLRHHPKLKGKSAYDRYDNQEEIDVPFTNAIPSDYDGVMGVPITFLDKYCPEQFEILGIANSARWICYRCKTVINGVKIYNRILIRHKK